jgi:hypothetical protein
MAMTGQKIVEDTKIQQQIQKEFNEAIKKN